MTEKVVELLYRSIIQHLSGNEEKAKEYTRKAMKIEKACVCGGTNCPLQVQQKISEDMHGMWNSIAKWKSGTKMLGRL